MPQGRTASWLGPAPRLQALHRPQRLPLSPPCAAGTPAACPVRLGACGTPWRGWPGHLRVPPRAGAHAPAGLQLPPRQRAVRCLPEHLAAGAPAMLGQSKGTAVCDSIQACRPHRSLPGAEERQKVGESIACLTQSIRCSCNTLGRDLFNRSRLHRSRRGQDAQTAHQWNRKGTLEASSASRALLRSSSLRIVSS